METGLGQEIALDIVAPAAGPGENSDVEGVATESPFGQMSPSPERGFRLRKGEPAPVGIKRIAREQIDKAVWHLRSKTKEPDEAIHSARICFKKLRAILRLVRSDVGAEIFRTENLCYRDAARRLSAVRDTAAMVETVENLGRCFPEELSAESVAELSGPFIRAERKAQIEKEKAMAEVAGITLSMRARLDQWPISRGFSAIKMGLKATYKQGQTAYERVLGRPTTTNLHEWRKHVKYLWYQISILKDASPKVAAKLAGKIGRLADYLSDAHDLAILIQSLRAGRHPHQDVAPEVESGLAVAERRRREVRKKALILGARVYAQKPGAFAGHFTRHWRRAKMERGSD